MESTISTTIDTTISTTIAKMSTVSNSTVARYSTMAIVDSSNDSNIVWVTSSIGISLRESIGNLSEGVGISISLGLTVSHGNGGQNNKGEGSHLAWCFGDSLTVTGPH